MPRFIHIGFNFQGPVLTTVLEPAMSGLGDWIRYSASSWIVWTDYQPQVIADYIRGHIGLNDQYLIVALDMSAHQGWMPKWVWDWINGKVRSQSLAGLGAFNPPAPPTSSGGLGGMGGSGLAGLGGLINTPPPKKNY